MAGLYWEEWEIDAEFVSSGTDGDRGGYSRVRGYCRETTTRCTSTRSIARKPVFGSRIAHGPLVYAIAAGLLFQLHLYDDTLIAFLGFDSLKFTKPVKPGDTIHARIKVLEKRETSHPERGVMKRQLQVVNQRGEVVQEGIQTFLLKRKPAEVLLDRFRETGHLRGIQVAPRELAEVFLFQISTQEATNRRDRLMTGGNRLRRSAGNDCLCAWR